MNETRNTLHKESVTLKRLQHRIQSQAVTIDNLNANFDALESIVNNLSRIVDKFEWTMRANLEARPVDAPIPPHLVVPTTQSPIYPRDCDEVYQSGGMRYLGDYYILVKPERSTTPFRALCKIMEGAGWTVIQRRHDGRENFTRDWEDYKHGFGDLQAEFWLGNENIHLLTTQDDYELRIVMEDWDGRRHHAEYDRFRVSGERSNFKLHVSGYHGNAGDSLTSFYHSHSGMEFSTYDRDNDRRLYDNCAEHYGSGWWYNDCYESHLNGKFYPHGSHDNFFIRDGILWNKIHQYASLKSTEMMIRPAPKAKLPNEI
ncbi:fibrinogen-like protein 1 [Dreissena polymorpha]|uniref:Fibrinogen C-terminal domain-containing protein n=1 Tax=Dreissena polymorpha TaxID=45954 RepID=A0A9D4MVB4_DREPO|nr:fibrinogen-like protein 1 [Dreissena polymorpha]XP_052220195.1 fibrinogen-like protein 1 [Dreissena polymorpha]KAH3884463.1 hypothetical protein DPMN_008443 [Dreissena polymorpha]